jgi:hypothetical protein
MTDNAKKVWEVMEEYGWINPPESDSMHLEYFEDIVKATLEAFTPDPSDAQLLQEQVNALKTELNAARQTIRELTAVLREREG